MQTGSQSFLPQRVFVVYAKLVLINQQPARLQCRNAKNSADVAAPLMATCGLLKVIIVII